MKRGEDVLLWKPTSLKIAHKEHSVTLNMLDNEGGIIALELTCLQYYFVEFLNLLLITACYVAGQYDTNCGSLSGWQQYKILMRSSASIHKILS